MEKASRSRLDEFFPAKKRRHLNSGDSSLRKSDAQVQQGIYSKCDTSPSNKGSLEHLIVNTQSQAPLLGQKLIEVRVPNEHHLEGREDPGTCRQQSKNEVHSGEKRRQFHKSCHLRRCKHNLGTPHVLSFSAGNHDKQNTITDEAVQQGSKKSLNAGCARTSKQNLDVSQRGEHEGKKSEAALACRVAEDKNVHVLTQFANDFLSICCSGIVSTKTLSQTASLDDAHLQNTCAKGDLENEGHSAVQRNHSLEIKEVLAPQDAFVGHGQDSCHKILNLEVAERKEELDIGIKVQQFLDTYVQSCSADGNKSSVPDKLVTAKIKAVTDEFFDASKIVTSSGHFKSPELAKQPNCPSLSGEKRKSILTPEIGAARQNEVVTLSGCFKSPEVANQLTCPSLSGEKRKSIITPEIGSARQKKGASGWVCGNSLFSPGDEFWDEAIHWADGLVANKVDDFAQARCMKSALTVEQLHGGTPLEISLKAIDTCNGDFCANTSQQSNEKVVDCGVIRMHSENPQGTEVPLCTLETSSKKDSKHGITGKCQVESVQPVLTRGTYGRVCSGTKDTSKVSRSESSPLPVRRFDFSSQENGHSFGRRISQAASSEDLCDRQVDMPIQVVDFIEKITSPCNPKNIISERSLEENQVSSEEQAAQEGHQEVVVGKSSNPTRLRRDKTCFSIGLTSRLGGQEVVTSLKANQAEANATLLEHKSITSLESGTPSAAENIGVPISIEKQISPDERFSNTVENVEDSSVNVTPKDLSSIRESRKKPSLTESRISDMKSDVIFSSSNRGVIEMTKEEFSNWLPAPVCSVYAKKGLKKLYPWQVECLQLSGVLQGKNLVYCASTSAGKSLVAEILMLKQVLSTGKKALLILPYVSICSEKAEHLESLLDPLGKKVCNFFGTHGSASLPKDASVAVCTIEKANSLINKLLEEGRLPELAVVVIDELHMIGDRDRGYLLELMLTKLRYAAGEGKDVAETTDRLPDDSVRAANSGVSDEGSGLQLIGMSATMPNAAAVANWLQAVLYETEFRPVPLVEFLKVGNTIYNKNMEAVRMIRKGADLAGKDPDHIVELCHEVVQEGHSVLLFCSSRKACETSAKHVAKFLPALVIALHSHRSGPENTDVALEELQKCPAGLDPVLAETLPKGVAYHHAGLTVEEREMVELCFRSGLVRVLTATSTLAAGVNLPARRVIFRQPRIGRDFIDGTRYRQMAGRAGRAGIDTKGESILICKPEELKRMSSLLTEGCQPLLSCLAEDKNGMTRAILEVVAGGIVQTANDVQRYVKCTLLNSTQPFREVVKSAQDSLRWLCCHKFLEWDQSNELYSSTPLGKAAFGSSLSPEESMLVFEDLAKAREGFVLASDLHLVYEVTPIYVDLEPDWGLYYKKFVELSPMDQAVGNRVGVMEPFLMRMAHGAPIVEIRGQRKWKSPKRKLGSISPRLCIDRRNNLSNISVEQTLRICKRFYVALMLARLIQETPLMEICESFKVARGMVQALQESSGRFAAMVSAFCERLGWHDLEALVSKFQSRVSFGVKAEIVELTEIPFVKASRARALYQAGLRTPQAVAEASLSELAKALFEFSSRASPDGSKAALHYRIQLGMAKKIKNGARKLVLDRAEVARVAAFSALRALGLDVPTALSQPLVLTDALGNKEGEDCGMLVNAEAALIHSKTGLPKYNEDGIAQNDNNNEKPEVKETVSKPSFHAGEASSEIGNYAFNGCSGASGPFCGTENKLLTYAGDTLDKGPIDVDRLSGGFDEFYFSWNKKREFFFDLHFSVLGREVGSPVFVVRGIAICWVGSPIYYVSFDVGLEGASTESDKNDLAGNSGQNNAMKGQDSKVCTLSNDRWTKVGMMFRTKGVLKVTWNWQSQINAFKYPSVCLATSTKHVEKMSTGMFEMGIGDNELVSLPGMIGMEHPVDVSLAAWLLWPDEESAQNFSLEQAVKKRLPGDLAARASREGRWINQMGRIAHNGCCRRAAQIRALHFVIWKLMISQGLDRPLLEQEMPLVPVLADMDAWGIRVDLKACKSAREQLELKLKELERRAHELAGVVFSLSVPAEVASVLYTHLKLPIPSGCKKGKQHPSTDKQALDALRDHHPIVEVVKEHRTLSKVLHSTLGSILSKARPVIIGGGQNGVSKCIVYNVKGCWLQTSTATGRLSMEEPNLQCVEHPLSFTIMQQSGNAVIESHLESLTINPRDFFMPSQDNWVLLSADYSQIEVRLMAHFSQDASLIELLSRPSGDLFVTITAGWTGVAETDVTQKQREHTKKIVYGILYGMGLNSLAEQLECSVSEAAEKYNRFKAAFPGVAKWLKEAVRFCREKGYVTTLAGRRRFLEKINYGSFSEKARAERQAVNSICQGSAADLIKIAMIDLHSTSSIKGDNRIISTDSKDHNSHSVLAGQYRLLLQIHDELVLEVDRTVIKEVAAKVRSCMESAAALRVPLRVKLKYGPKWGSLQPLQET